MLQAGLLLSWQRFPQVVVGRYVGGAIAVQRSLRGGPGARIEARIGGPCDPRIRVGARLLALVDGHGRFAFGYQSAFALGAAARDIHGVDEATLLASVDRWLAAVGSAQRSHVLAELATTAAGRVGYDAAWQLSDSPDLVGALAPVDRSALIAAVSVAPPRTAGTIARVLARLHAVDAVVALVDVLGRQPNRFAAPVADIERSLEILTNHLDPGHAPFRVSLDAPGTVAARWRAWQAAHAFGDAETMLAAGWERGVGAPAATDVSSLAAVIRRAADPLGRVIAMERCERVTGTTGAQDAYARYSTGVAETYWMTLATRCELGSRAPSGAP